jgi:hypothetical protein
VSNIPPGKYMATPVSAEHGINKNGKDYINLVFEIPFSDGTVESIADQLYFATDENAKISMKNLRTCGWDGEDIVALSGFGTKKVQLVLEEESFVNDAGLTKTTTKVKYINTPGGAVVTTPMSEGQKQTFAQRMRGLVLAEKQAAGGSGAARPTANRQPAQPRREPASYGPQGTANGQQPRRAEGAYDPGPDEDLPFLETLAWPPRRPRDLSARHPRAFTPRHNAREVSHET